MDNQLKTNSTGKYNYTVEDGESNYYATLKITCNGKEIIKFNNCKGFVNTLKNSYLDLGNLYIKFLEQEITHTLSYPSGFSSTDDIHLYIARVSMNGLKLSDEKLTKNANNVVADLSSVTGTSVWGCGVILFKKA